MQENIDISKKDDYLTEVTTLKKKYKNLKEKLEWADDEFEEESIQEKMDHFATQIRTLNQKLAAIESMQKEA